VIGASTNGHVSSEAELMILKWPRRFIRLSHSIDHLERAAGRRRLGCIWFWGLHGCSRGYATTVRLPLLSILVPEDQLTTDAVRRGCSLNISSYPTVGSASRALSSPRFSCLLGLIVFKRFGNTNRRPLVSRQPFSCFSFNPESCGGHSSWFRWECGLCLRLPKLIRQPEV
jgi:hypothetical protein